MKRLMLSFLVLGACSTPPPPPPNDIDVILEDHHRAAGRSPRCLLHG